MNEPNSNEAMNQWNWKGWMNQKMNEWILNKNDWIDESMKI
jgi:hypothetical protein